MHSCINREMGVENSCWLGWPLVRNSQIEVPRGGGGTDFCPNTKFSQFAKGVGKVQPLLRLGTRFQVKNGRVTLFWLDRWCNERALNETYPRLFSILNNPEAKVADVWTSNRWVPRFQRTLGALETQEWEGLPRYCRP